ncbi:MAG: pseudaminic acid synthase [Desulfovibrio sp.]|nr:pseudaminic acid synthase [Desulfovibrio sp.]MBI4959112.1 pseudaminic acid synthase [Desulfovibrio sp.]
MSGFSIDGRDIGPGLQVYVVAELSGNHGGDFERALALVQAAFESGADAIKLQTYTPDSLTIDCNTAPFRIKDTPWGGRTLHDLYAEAATPWEWQPKLFKAARDLGMGAFSSAFDETAVDFLESLSVSVHKVASFEIVDLALLRRIAATGKPVMLSTGMASLAEIEEAVTVLRQGGAGPLALLRCVSSYPAQPEDMNLRTIPMLSQLFGTVAGLSDHSLDIVVPVCAVALGACLVEKHLTLRRSDGGPDAMFSLEPHEFADMVRAVKTASTSMGGVRFAPVNAELPGRVFRRSLFVVKDMRAGDVFDELNVRSIRPGYGLPPRFLEVVLGRRAASDIPRGTPVSFELLSPVGND